MTQACIDWEKNLLLLLSDETRRVQEELRKKERDPDDVFDEYLDFLLAAFAGNLRNLYEMQYLGVEWKIGMAEPLFPAERSDKEFLNKKVGRYTLAQRLEDVVAMADFFTGADPDGRGVTVWSDVQRQLETYARCEGHRVLNEARTQAVDDVLAAYPGSRATKTWDATLDEKTRQTHMMLHGQTIQWDKHFWTHNGAALYPGGFGVPEEDVNCRCVLQCRVTGGKFRRVNGKKDFIAWLQEVNKNG